MKEEWGGEWTPKAMPDEVSLHPHSGCEAISEEDLLSSAFFLMFTLPLSHSFQTGGQTFPGGTSGPACQAAIPEAPTAVSMDGCCSTVTSDQGSGGHLNSLVLID